MKNVTYKLLICKSYMIYIYIEREREKEKEKIDNKVIQAEGEIF